MPAQLTHAQRLEARAKRNAADDAKRAQAVEAAEQAAAKAHTDHAAKRAVDTAADAAEDEARISAVHREVCIKLHPLIRKFRSTPTRDVASEIVRVLGEARAAALRDTGAPLNIFVPAFVFAEILVGEDPSRLGRFARRDVWLHGVGNPVGPAAAAFDRLLDVNADVSQTHAALLTLEAAVAAVCAPGAFVSQGIQPNDAAKFDVLRFGGSSRAIAEAYAAIERKEQEAVDAVAFEVARRHKLKTHGVAHARPRNAGHGPPINDPTFDEALFAEARGLPVINSQI